MTLKSRTDFSSHNCTNIYEKITKNSASKMKIRILTLADAFKLNSNQKKYAKECIGNKSFARFKNLLGLGFKPSNSHPGCYGAGST